MTFSWLFNTKKLLFRILIKIIHVHWNHCITKNFLTHKYEKCKSSNSHYLKITVINILLTICYVMHFMHTHVSCFLYIYLFYLFIFGCVGSSLLCTSFLWLRWAEATLRFSTWASYCGGFSCCGARALGLQASVVVACGLSSHGSWSLERRLSSCGTWA